MKTCSISALHAVPPANFSPRNPMPLKINLYHEVLRARHEVQYDPLRLSMMGLVAVVVCLAGYYTFALIGKSSVVRTFEQKKREFDQLQPKVKAAKEQEETLTKQLALGDTLQARMEERFYWGPIFEQLASLTPLNVQITRCTGDVAAEMPRRCQIAIEGIAAGPEPRRIAEEFRVRMVERLGGAYKNVNASFRTLEDGPERVMADGAKSETANFTIAINFLTKSTPEPTPPPKKTTRRLPKDEAK